MLTETSSRKSRNKELKALLGGAKVDLEAILGHANLTMKDILEIESGDIIRLDRNANDTAILRVDGKDKFLAQIGVNRYRKSAKVIEILKTEHDEVKEILEKIEFARKSKINMVEEEK
jgi:flagellar motor switch protein FliM